MRPATRSPQATSEFNLHRSGDTTLGITPLDPLSAMYAGMLGFGSHAVIADRNGTPPRRMQYDDNIWEVALSEGSRSAPIGIPLEVLNSGLRQSLQATSIGSRLRGNSVSSRMGSYWGLSPSASNCRAHSAGGSRSRSMPIPRGRRPSTAALTRAGARKASEMVKLT